MLLNRNMLKDDGADFASLKCLSIWYNENALQTNSKKHWYENQYCFCVMC